MLAVGKLGAAYILVFLLVGLGGCASNPSKNMMDQFDEAERAYSLGLLSNAEATYLEITEKHPNFGEAWFRLGNIYVRTGQFDAAIRMFEKYVKINPNDVRGWNNLALTRMKQAVDVLQQGQKKFSRDSNEYHYLEEMIKRMVNVTGSGAQ